ncbi:GNAT family N-acetyltransferase [Kineobactrum salinum]|uniref:GNAT family N-acetyltransferase n=2 Tax=Kineobactrum salinum TaxID=2708301 RepID=A0A6C0UA02_9GAMM|nr:GNAT family N-acetyltransferase [Kineobactrum salinum]
MFSLEATDVAMLEDPVAKVIAPGGKIWFARHPQHGVVGTCALLKQEAGVYELTKMGVTESARGLKVGEQLLQYVLARAGQMNMQCLFLLTNRRCEAAIHLYEKNGFRHCEDIMQRFGSAYERCNVAMRYVGI